MIAVRLPEELERRLDELAAQTGRSRSYYVRRAIEEFLEDREDYLLAAERLANPGRRLSQEEVERLLDLAD